MVGLLPILLLSQLVLLPDFSSSLPLCTDLRPPFIHKTPLAFCPYNGTVCCDSAKDLGLQKQFQAMNISSPLCASLLKSILCATCDPYSSELYKTEPGTQPIPILCNSTASSKSENSFCSTVWNECQNVSISNSPFAPSLQGRAGGPINSSSPKTLSQLWQAESDFCNAFGGTSNNKLLCFNGEPVSLKNISETLNPPKGLCLEKIADGGYINMVAHPDGSNRAFFNDQPGKIWLATVPQQGSGEPLGLNESDPFVDLSDKVHFDPSFGMLGLAFHPKFASNGRFFASYNCDKVKSPDCSGTCSCNSDVSCDPSKISSTPNAQPCQYHSVIAEFTANGTTSDPSSARSAKPSEVRRIFTMGLPATANHGGQILFGPDDGYLYFMMGDGGVRGDPYGFSQNKKSLLGKIMRLDIDNIPSKEEMSKLGLWGSYSIPKDNPYSNVKEMKPEIWALGFRNPWRCSFDAERPSYFLCGDVGENKYEEVNVVTKGGNYGWSVYEGRTLFKSQQSSTGNTSANSIVDAIFPVMGYYHSDINKKPGSAAISGGFIYRSTTDPCMYGSYLYGDLYATAIWAAVENPTNSGNYTTTKIPFSCAGDSPIQCSSIPGSTTPSLGYIYSFAQDNNKDIFILTSNGVYRAIRPSRCNYACSKENVTETAAPRPSPSPSSSYGNKLIGSDGVLLISLALFFVIALCKVETVLL